MSQQPTTAAKPQESPLRKILRRPEKRGATSNPHSGLVEAFTAQVPPKLSTWTEDDLLQRWRTDYQKDSRGIIIRWDQTGSDQVSGEVHFTRTGQTGTVELQRHGDAWRLVGIRSPGR